MTNICASWCFSPKPKALPHVAHWDAQRGSTPAAIRSLSYSFPSSPTIPKRGKSFRHQSQGKRQILRWTSSVTPGEATAGVILSVMRENSWSLNILLRPKLLSSIARPLILNIWPVIEAKYVGLTKIIMTVGSVGTLRDRMRFKAWLNLPNSYHMIDFCAPPRSYVGFWTLVHFMLLSNMLQFLESKVNMLRPQLGNIVVDCGELWSR